MALVCAGFGPLAAGALYDRLGSYTVALGLTAAVFPLAAAAMYATPKPDLATLAV